MRALFCIILLGLAVVCAWQWPSQPTAYAWNLPDHFPVPRVPQGNPMRAETVELGRHLFYDRRLSLNESMSCADCHQQHLAFTDGKPQAVGSTGAVHPRGSMSLANVAYASRLTWANDLLVELEHQAQLPLFGEEPIEMGMSGQEQLLIERLQAEPRYESLFRAAFPQTAAPELTHVLDALAAFQRSLISADSPYDRYLAGDPEAISPAARRGMELFFSERLECFHCHGGFNFSDTTGHAGQAVPEFAYHNTGLYNVDGNGAYPVANQGRYEQSGRPEDMGQFRAPSLRNIAVTGPYMHDGSVATLDEVLDHYARGGRRLVDGPNAGDGAENPYKSEFVAGFVLTKQERADVLAFLHSLTDEAFLTDPRHGNPWD